MADIDPGPFSPPIGLRREHNKRSTGVNLLNEFEHQGTRVWLPRLWPPLEALVRPIKGGQALPLEPSRTDQATFRSASITSANVRWPGKIQFSPGSTSRAATGEAGNNSGWAFFHLANTTLLAINRSLM